MILFVHVPCENIQERRYVIRHIFERTLGIKTKIICESRSDSFITCEERDGPRLYISDGFMANKIEDWPEVVKNIEVSNSNRSDELVGDLEWNEPLPILFDLPEPARAKNEAGRLTIDIFGTIFIFLSRYEEYVHGRVDEIGRVILEDSFQVRFGLDRVPIVDLYIEIIWSALVRIWPYLERKRLSYELNITHDIDRIYKESKQSVLDVIKQFAIQVKGLDGFRLWLDNLSRWIKVRSSGLEHDSYNTYDFLCEQSEMIGLKSTFYVVADRPFGKKDSNYDINDPEVAALLSALASRGHKIGLHPSFGTFQDAAQMTREVSILANILERLGIDFKKIKSRQHYLRYQLPDTLQCWVAANIVEDSTIGFHDRVGFRAGTCRSFKLYNCNVRKETEIVEYPLLMMEQSLLSPKYMGLTEPSSVTDALKETVQMCRKFDGCMTILWHNSMLYSPELKDIYREVIQMCKP